jgi:hypothetical protein
MLVDFHAAYKPVGLNRTYPNVINYESVKGLEQSKWDRVITPIHDTTLPFTRMVAGPMDFTPGAMINTNRDEFRRSFTSPMSRGTRRIRLQCMCSMTRRYRCLVIVPRITGKNRFTPNSCHVSRLSGIKL